MLTQLSSDGYLFSSIQFPFVNNKRENEKINQYKWSTLVDSYCRRSLAKAKEGLVDDSYACLSTAIFSSDESGNEGVANVKDQK